MPVVLNDDGARAKNQPRRKKRFKIVRLGTERREFTYTPRRGAHIAGRHYFSIPSCIKCAARHQSVCCGGGNLFAFHSVGRPTAEITCTHRRTKRKTNLRIKRTRVIIFSAPEICTFPLLAAPKKHWRHHRVVFEPNCAQIAGVHFVLSRLPWASRGEHNNGETNYCIRVTRKVECF